MLTEHITIPENALSVMVDGDGRLIWTLPGGFIAPVDYVLHPMAHALGLAAELNTRIEVIRVMTC